MLHVLIAEDSLTVRELLVEILESDPEIKVVGQAKNGLEAVDLASRLKPDLITMDVHMPLVDGFEATKEIMALAPVPIILVSGSGSHREVELSLNAMRVGALMVVEKPGRPDGPEFARQRDHLLAMVKAMAAVKVVRRRASTGRSATRAARGPASASRPAVRVVAIAASTGGPAAIQQVLGDLRGDFPVPVLVVQHIASGFLAGLADWLGSGCRLRVKVAEDGEPLRARTVYLAPEDRHLGLREDGRILVSNAPATNGFRPSATFLFASAARTYGAAAVAVILTGMGTDGLEGLKAAKAAGASVLAQDEATSVVYGMPREAVEAGVVDAVLPIGAMGAKLTNLVAGGQP